MTSKIPPRFDDGGSDMKPTSSQGLNSPGYMNQVPGRGLYYVRVRSPTGKLSVAKKERSPHRQTIRCEKRAIAHRQKERSPTGKLSVAKKERSPTGKISVAKVRAIAQPQNILDRRICVLPEIGDRNPH